MPSYSSLTERIKGKGAAAWDVHKAAVKRAAAGEDIIFLSIGDPDFSTPAEVVDAAVDALRKGDTHYTDITGRPRLWQGIIDRFNRQTGLSLTPRNVVAFPGTQNSLYAASSCLLETGNEDSGLVFEGEHISIASLPGMAERTVTVGSLSKSHAMTGWRCGWMIGPEELCVHAARLNMSMLYGMPGFIQAGGIVGLANADEIVDEMRSTYRRRRDLVAQALQDAVDLPILVPDAVCT